MRMGPVASVILIILGFRKTFAASLPTLRAQPPLIRRAIIMTAGVVIALAGQADAVTMGDHFTDTARGTYRTVVAPGVPEPSTLLLLSSALAALAAWRRGSKPGTSCR